MRLWWNGIHNRLKICRRKLAGSNPANRTRITSIFGRFFVRNDRCFKTNPIAPIQIHRIVQLHCLRRQDRFRLSVKQQHAFLSKR